MDRPYFLLSASASATGEQAKFLALVAGVSPVLVKFLPPRGTPFGDLWSELLRAEVLALQTLTTAGAHVAEARLLVGKTRTFLESPRFDRVGALGRRHVVSLDAAAHRGFVAGTRRHWVVTGEQNAARV